MTGVGNVALRQAQQVIKGHQKNIENANVGGAHNVETTVISGPYYNKVTQSRNFDPLREAAYVKQITDTANKMTTTRTLGTLENIILVSSDKKDSRISKLTSSIDEFLAHSTVVAKSDNSLAVRQSFIDKGKHVAETLTDAYSKVTDLRLGADRDLRESVDTVNNAIKNLHRINRDLATTTSNAMSLQDSRDRLIYEIAEQFDIKVQYGQKGTALITAANSGKEIVSNTGYAKFNYQGTSKADLLRDKEMPPVTMTHFDSLDKQLGEMEVLSGSIKEITGGKWAALVDLRDNILVNSSGAIKSLASNFAKKVNEAHNDGSTFPPKGRFESSIEVSGDQVLEWGGKVEIFALDKDGKQLTGGAGGLNCAAIDMANLRGSNPSGGATVKDLINELNEKLNLAPSRPRAALGKILDGTGTHIPGQYLLNNIQLAGTGDIKDGKISFDLDLQGSKYFGSKVEVLGVKGPNGFLPQDQLPAAFKLEKDTNTRTGQTITLDGFAAGTGDKAIGFGVKITGDNGVISIGNLNFVVDTNNPAMLNKRIAYDATFGEFTEEGVTNSGVARAKLIDANGNEIDPASGTKGKLVIEANGDNRIAIQGGNFSALFGFNNLFNFADETGELVVNPEIANDVSQLATGKVSRTDGAEQPLAVGDVKASATMLFVGNLDATSVVSIAGTNFTFVAAATTRNQVNVADGLQGLVDAINNHPKVNSTVMAALNATGDMLTITAQTAGTWGNDIKVAANIVGGTVDLDSSGMSVANLPAANLTHGTNKVESHKIFEYNIASASNSVLDKISALQSDLMHVEGSGMVPTTTTSLSNFATMITGLLSGQVNDAEMAAEVAENVQVMLDEAMKRDFGINKEEEWVKFVDAARYAKNIADVMRLYRETLDEIYRKLFG